MHRKRERIIQARRSLANHILRSLQDEKFDLAQCSTTPANAHSRRHSACVWVSVPFAVGRYAAAQRAGHFERSLPAQSAEAAALSGTGPSALRARSRASTATSGSR